MSYRNVTLTGSLCSASAVSVAFHTLKLSQASWSLSSKPLLDSCSSMTPSRTMPALLAIHEVSEVEM